MSLLYKVRKTLFALTTSNNYDWLEGPTGRLEKGDLIMLIKPQLYYHFKTGSCFCLYNTEVSKI